MSCDLMASNCAHCKFRQTPPPSCSSSSWRLSIQIAWDLKVTSICEQCFSRQSPPDQLGYLVFSLKCCQLKTTDCALIMSGGNILLSVCSSLIKQSRHLVDLGSKILAGHEEVKLKVLFRICVKQNMLLLLAVYSYYLISQVCSSLIKQRVKISFVIFCKLCGVVKFYVSSSTLVYIILVYLVLVFD